MSMDQVDAKLKDILEFWLISAPGDKTCQQTWEKMNNLMCRQHNLSFNFKFHIPDLKVGTLDVLVGLSDELCKLDAYIDTIVRKVANYMREVMERESDKVQESLLVNGYSMKTYLTKFQWDLAKYSVNQPIKNISDLIAKQVTQIENDLKTKSQAYNNLKGNIQNLEKKAMGTLVSKDLSQIVHKEDFVLGSEYLQTVLIVVQKNHTKDFLAKYETLCDMIVPRSAREITRDQDFVLYAVTIFKKVLAEFRNKAKADKFIVRDFEFNEEVQLAGRTEITKLVSDKKKQFGPLVRWLRVNFGECFVAFAHVKALRLYVESVLRYGLPVNFQPILMAVPKKNHKKAKEILNQLYGHLDNSGMSSMEMTDIPGFTATATAECYPYVFVKIVVDISH